MINIHDIVGQDTRSMMSWWQMSVRAIFIFFYLLILIRIGGKRAFGKNTAFDIVIGVMLGSTLSRALTGNSPFLPTLAASATLVLIHYIIGRLAFHNQGVSHLVKGEKEQLIEDGKIILFALKRNNITLDDITEAMRSTAKSEDLSAVKDAFLERNGKISIIQRKSA